MATCGSAARHARATKRALTFAFGLMLLGATAFPVLLAGPALAAPPVQDCTNTSTGQCARLTPQFTCVWNNGGGSYTAVFGYTNASPSHDLTASVGPNNGFSPAPADRGQPTFFPQGTVTNSFAVTWNGSALTWTLPGGSATATSSGTPCSGNPVPEFSDWRAIVAAVLLLLPALAFKGRRAFGRHLLTLRSGAGGEG